MIAHGDLQLAVVNDRRDFDRGLARRILRGVFDQVRQGRRREPRVDADGGIVGVARDLDAVVAKQMLHLLRCRRDHFSGLHPFELSRHGVDLDARHVHDVLEQPVQSGELGLRQIELIVAIAFYVTKPDLGGINAGLIAVLVNLVLTFGLSLLGERVERQPMCSWSPAAQRSAKVPADGQAVFRPALSD